MSITLLLERYRRNLINNGGSQPRTGIQFLIQPSILNKLEWYEIPISHNPKFSSLIGTVIEVGNDCTKVHWKPNSIISLLIPSWNCHNFKVLPQKRQASLPAATNSDVRELHLCFHKFSLTNLFISHIFIPLSLFSNGRCCNYRPKLNLISARSVLVLISFMNPSDVYCCVPYLA